ncbi:amidohydrolase [Streptomyces sp. MUM 203J]|uniref:amidohydrolase n=1 Tax=Streptomyces sp. MUM 203J TaxID=2791990 RepID=UPI001F03E3D2|nr:amidohydrolase [Streptomyces sp. MUM 203J]MCH0538172.1 amidohydrolase [Streptomyces sp. MUM 203J]
MPVTPGTAGGPSAPPLPAIPREALRPALELYLDLHAHPEPSGAEHRTADRFAAELARHGCAVTLGVGGHGVVGVLRGGPGPTVLLRAELDALPVTERTGLPYASTVPGVMHACGHDLHLAAVAGAAGELARMRDRWRGTVLLVGQPAEETLTGARAMLDDGLYDRFGTPDLALAQHTAPLPAGTVAHATPGTPLMSGSVTLDVVIHGRGGHAGTPHLTADPVLAAAAAVVRLQSVVSRETAPSEQAVLTVGALRAGESANITPDRAELKLSIRAFTDETLTRTRRAAERVIRAESEASACPRPPEFAETSRSHPLTPDSRATARLTDVHQQVLGPHRVLHTPPTTATEDFSRYGSGGVPLAYWLLGVTGARAWREARAGGPPVPPNHAPGFAPDVRTALPAGIAALTSAALHALEEASP